MVHKDEVSAQLKRLGMSFQFWCRAEVRELPKILFEGEQLQHVLIGRYEGGFALFVATDQRVLLIDKKPFYLTLEDIRYDMVSDVQFNHRLIDATMRLGTMHKTLWFTAYNHNKLRHFTNFIQEQVLIFRQQQNATQPRTVLQPSLQPSVQTSSPQQQSALGATSLQAAFTINRPPVVNPYNMPVMIRRRVSRFY